MTTLEEQMKEIKTRIAVLQRLINDEIYLLNASLDRVKENKSDVQ